jgi:Cu(I)/Ag(I) efflux system membrane fusion protein
LQKLSASRLQVKNGQAAASKAGKAGGADTAVEEHKYEVGKKKAYWTCGMHPQIVEGEPGTCPICGMDLVQKEVK